MNKRLGRTLFWTAAALLLLVLLVPIASLVVLLNSERARLWAVGKGLEFANSETLVIQTEQLQWPEFGQLQMAGFSLRRNGAKMLEVKDFKLLWQPWALGEKKIHINELSASLIEFKQGSPDDSPTPPEPEPQGETRLPEFWQVRLDRLSVERLSLNLNSTPEPLPDYSITADATLFGEVAPVVLNLDVRSLAPADASDFEATRLTITTEVSERRRVAIAGSFFEPADGMLGRLIQLPATQALDTQFAIELQQQADHWQVDIAQFRSPYLNHQLALRGTLQISPEARQIIVPELVLAIDDKPQRLQGRYTPEILEFDVELQALPLDLGNPWLPERLDGSLAGTAAGQWRLAEQRLPAAEFKLQADAVIRDQTTRLNVAGSSADDLLQIDRLTLAQGAARIQASGHLDPFAQRTSLVMNFQQLDSELLQPWIAQWPQYLSFTAPQGKVTVKGALTAPEFTAVTQVNASINEQDYAIELDGRFDLHSADVQTLVINSNDHHVDVTGQVDWRKQVINLSLNARNLTETLVENLDVVDAVELPEGLTFDFDGRARARGQWTSPSVDADFTIAGQYALPADTVTYQLAFTGTAAGERITRYQLDLENLNLAVNDASVLDARGNISRSNADLSVNINRLPIGLLAALGISGVSGEAEGELRLQGTPQAPKINGRLAYDNPEEQIEVNAKINTEDQILRVALDFQRAATDIGDFMLTLPLATYLNIGDGAQIPLDFTGAGELDLALAQMFVNPDIQQIGGILRVDLQASGTLAAPGINGYVRSDNIHYENFVTNTRLQKITLDVVGSRDKLELNSLMARDDSGGTTELTGTVQLGPSYRNAGDMVQLRLKTREADLASTEMLNGRLDSDITLHGNLDEMWLTGKGKIQPLNISIDQAFGSSIPSIQYTEVTEDASQEGAGPIVHMDLQIDIENQAFIRGRGLITEVRGGISVGGTLDNIDYQGQFSTFRGQMDLFNKRFELQEGNVRISNEVVSFRIVAVHEEDDTEFTVTVAGTADAPEVSLSSSPALPEDEILARLLFGKSIQDVSAFQAIQLGLAARQLAQGGALGYQDSARKYLGVDRLSIDQEELASGESGYSVGVGKYVSEDVYVELKHSPDPAQPWQGRVEVELTPNLSIQSSTTETGGGRADILWKMDY